ncbi:MAG: hypothetical protein LBU14_05560, partial [Candidatus Peribacteria bacterium]|nr:hypothetical protein [Candidatus Peribacteria bacterium]
PIEKLKQSNILYSVKFNSFPIFLLEDIEKIGGTYLKDYYLNFLFNFSQILYHKNPTNLFFNLEFIIFSLYIHI